MPEGKPVSLEGVRHYHHTSETDDPPSRSRVLDDELTDSPPSGLCMSDPDHLPAEFAITYFENSDLESVDDMDFDWDGAITARYGVTEVVESKSKGKGKNKAKRRGNVLEGPNDKPMKRVAPLSIEQKIRQFQEHRRLNKWKPAPKIFCIDETDDFADSDDDEEDASWVSCSDTSSWSKVDNSNPFVHTNIPLSPSLVTVLPLSPSLVTSPPSSFFYSASLSPLSSCTGNTSSAVALPSLTLPPSTFAISQCSTFSLSTYSPPQKPLSPPPPSSTLSSSYASPISPLSFSPSSTTKRMSSSPPPPSPLSPSYSSRISSLPPSSTRRISLSKEGKVKTDSLRSQISAGASRTVRSLSTSSSPTSRPTGMAAEILQIYGADTEEFSESTEITPRVNNEEMDGMLATLRDLVLQKQKALGAANLAPGSSLESDALPSPVLQKLAALQQAMRHRT